MSKSFSQMVGGVLARRIARTLSSSGRRSNRSRLRIESLEDRAVPAIFTVANLGDNGGTNPAAGAGTGTLRQAIVDANASAAADTINFSVTGTIPLAAALPQFTDTGALTITGPGAANLTVDGVDAFQVFRSNVSTLTITGLTVTRGRLSIADNAARAADGPGLKVNKADSFVTLDSVVFTNNHTTGTNGDGGAVALNGGVDLLVRNSTFSGNSAAKAGGAIYFQYNGTLLMENTTISGNDSLSTSDYYGGGAFYFWGTPDANVPTGFTSGALVVRNSTIANNTAAASGGGILLENFDGALLVQNSTITGNDAGSATAYYGGGGIALYYGGGTITLTNSIISGNTNGANAPNITSPNTVNVNFSAIDDQTGFSLTGSNNYTGTFASLNLGVLTDNGGPTETMLPGALSPLIDAGDATLTAGSLITDQRGFGYVRTFNSLVDIGALETQPTGIPAASSSPALVDTSNNGQTTYTFTVTYADLTGGNRGIDVSTVIDNDLAIRVTGPNGFNQLAEFVSIDFLFDGTPRTATYSITTPGSSWNPADNGTYTVSVEANQIFDVDNPNPNAVPAGQIATFNVVISPITVTNLNDSGSGSLRDAIGTASLSPGNDEILFDPTLFVTPQSIFLTSSLSIGSSGGGLTITGPGANFLTVSGQDTVRVIDSSAPTLNLTGFTVAHGFTAGAVPDEFGGGIRAAGFVTLEKMVISENTALGGENTGYVNYGGGGIGMKAGAALIVRNTTISDNVAAHAGGGIFFRAGGALLVDSSTISGNSAAPESNVFGGGGIWFFQTPTATPPSPEFTPGAIVILNSTIANNTSTGSGGGLEAVNASGGVIIQNSTITGNESSLAATGNSKRGGGGVALIISGAYLVAANSIISGNTNADAADIASFYGRSYTYFTAIGNRSGFTENGPGTGNLADGSIETLLLGELADNGGLTKTIAPQPGSPLIDQGDDSFNFLGTALNDQLGSVHDRIFGATLDIGSYEVQATGVTVDVAVGQADPTNGTPSMVFEIQFAVPVTGFTVDDITIGGTYTLDGGTFDANLDPVSGSLYRLVLTNFDAGLEGTIEVSIDADVAFDGSQTGNLASTASAAVSIDTVSPEVTIDQDGLQDDPTNGSITFNVSFTEDVTGFSFSSVSFNLGAGVTGTPIGTFSVIDAANYTVTVTGGITGQGTLTAQILPGVVTDAVGNSNTLSTSSDNTVEFDDIAPTVTINPTDLSPTVGGNSVSFNVVFSEEVVGLTTGSFNVSGAPGATVTGLSGTGPAYVVTVSGMTAGGTITLDLPAAAVQDVAGNDNTAATGDKDVVFVNSGTLQFSAPTYTQTEQGGLLATITVTRVVTAGVGEGNLSVTYATVVGGDASPGVGLDYLSTSGILIFGPLDTSKTFQVQILDDSIVEGNETVNLALSNISVPGALGTPATAVLTITDFEEGDFTFSSPTYTAAENGVIGTASIVINRVNGSDGAADVTYSLTLGSAEGTDIGTPTLAPGVVNFLNGETTKTIVIPIFDDGLSEGFETVNFGLTGPTNGATLGAITAATLTIDPSDPIALGLAQKFTVKLTDPVDGDIATVRLVGSTTGTLNVYLNDQLPASKIGPISLLELDGTNPTTSSLIVSVAKARPINAAADGKMNVGGVRSIGANIGLRAFTAVKSDLDGTGINLSGYLGGVTVANVTNGADITAAANANPRLKTTLNLGRVGNDTNITTGPINVLNTIEFGDGTITAPTIGSLLVKGTKLAPASAGNFGGNVVLSGAIPLPNGVTPATVNLIKIAGSLLPTADIDVAGKATSVLVGTPGGNLDVFDGSLEADSVVNITVFGNLTGDINVTGAGVANGKFALTNLKVLGANVRTGAVFNFVGGTVDGANIQVGSSSTVGNVNTVTATKFINSTFAAGYTGLPNGSGTFNPIGSLSGTVNSFSITGRPNEIDAFANSNVLASTFKRVTLRTVDTTNATAFGFTAADAVVSLKVTTITPAFSVTNLTTVGAPVIRDQFTVKVV